MHDLSISENKKKNTPKNLKKNTPISEIYLKKYIWQENC